MVATKLPLALGSGAEVVLATKRVIGHSGYWRYSGMSNQHIESESVSLVILLCAVLGEAQTRSLGLGLEFGVWSMGRLGFSEQVAALTLLSCPVFDNRQRAHCKMRWTMTMQ